VANGVELGSGSIRIHSQELQARVFQMLGLSEEQRRERFGFFLDALTYGTPPHGGIALGIDRIIALLAGEKSMREVIAFPKTTAAQDLMAESPSPVEALQLEELNIAFPLSSHTVRCPNPDCGKVWKICGYQFTELGGAGQWLKCRACDHDLKTLIRPGAEFAMEESPTASPPAKF